MARDSRRIFFFFCVAGTAIQRARIDFDVQDSTTTGTTFHRCPPSKSVAIPAIGQRTSGSRRFGREKNVLALRRSIRKAERQKSGCKLNLQITRTTIVSVIAVSVAKEKADLVSKMMMPPGHKTDSNPDQSVAHGHCGAFVDRDFLRKGDVLVTRIDRLARNIGDFQDIVRAVRARGAYRHQHRSRQMFPRYSACLRNSKPICARSANSKA